MNIIRSHFRLLRIETMSKVWEGFEPTQVRTLGLDQKGGGRISTSRTWVQPRFNPGSTQVQIRFNPGSGSLTQVLPRFSGPVQTWNPGSMVHHSSAKGWGLQKGLEGGLEKVGPLILEGSFKPPLKPPSEAPLRSPPFSSPLSSPLSNRLEEGAVKGEPPRFGMPALL